MNINWVMPNWMEEYMKDYILPSADFRFKVNRKLFKIEIENLYNSVIDSECNPYNVMVKERCDLLQKLHDDLILKHI